MARALLGLLKGLIVGGVVGYGFLRLGSVVDMEKHAVLTYLACALVGALVGLVAGRAPWRAETIWTPVIKVVVGIIVGSGLCALGRHLLPWSASISIEPVAKDIPLHGAAVLSLLIGLLYGVFVEVDDGVTGKDEAKKKS